MNEGLLLGLGFARKRHEMGKSFLGFDTDKCWDYENGFYLTSHVTRLSKMLAQYEL